MKNAITETPTKIWKTLPAQMHLDGWNKGGTTSDRAALKEIDRDYKAAGYKVAFSRGAMDDVHYWFKKA